MKSETSLNGIVDSKAEAELHSENISTKAHNVKEEPLEVSDTKASTATSEPSSETLCLSVKSEKVEEIKRNSAEEIQQTLKNDQQAKIPLKKRGMKFSEDFEKNSCIIVQNQSASQVKNISKSDTAPEQTKNALNDHVNGEVQLASEKDLQSHLSEPLKDTCGYKEQKNETNTGRSAVVRENKLPSTDKEGMKDRKDKDCTAEKVTEVVPSHQAYSDKRALDMQEKETTAGTEKREAHDSPLSPKAESTPLLKDVNNALEESSNHEKHENVTEKPAAAEESCSGDKATTNESDNLPLNHDVTPKETESKDSKDLKTGCIDMDTSESSQMEETKTSKTSEIVSDVKQVEVCDTEAKDTAISEMNIEKSNSSESKEKPVGINTTETQSADKDPAKKMDDSENSVSPSSTKTTEILTDVDNTVTKESNEMSNTKEPVELSVVEKVTKSESFKPAEKQCNISDSDATPKKNSADSETNTEMENTEETEKPEDTKKSVICEDNTLLDVTTISDSVPVPMEVEAVAVKQDLTKPQEDDKIEMNSVEHKTTEETSEGKDKPSRLVEKTKVSEETDKESNKEEENVSEEQHSKTEKEHPSSEIKEDADAVSKKDTDSEKCTKDNKEHLCQEKESHKDSTTDESSITDQTKEEKHKKSKTSTMMEESGQKSVSKEPDAKSSSETEKPGLPSKEPETDKSTDEESKSKSGDSATMKEVANGVEAPTDVQVEGGCRKIKPPAHRRKAELQREERQGDSESDSNTGRSLRRSPRISRPTPKAVEIHDRKTEKPQAAPSPEKHEKDKDEKDGEEEEEEVVVKAVQKKQREKKPDQEGQPKPKVRLLTR